MGANYPLAQQTSLGKQDSVQRFEVRQDTSRPRRRTMPTGTHSTRPISERLADLSQRAKATEDGFATARTETKQKLDARLDQARTSVEQLKQTIQQDASAATEQAKSQWQELQGRIAKRVDKIKDDLNAQKQQFAADRAAVRADSAEDEAAAAIDDAIGAIEYARYSVLYAASARQEADSATR
jgi:hypothetical protein